MITVFYQELYEFVHLLSENGIQNKWEETTFSENHFKTINAQFKEASLFTDRLRILFYKPGWSAKMAAYIPVPDIVRDSVQKFDTLEPVSVNWYVIFQYVRIMIVSYTWSWHFRYS